MPGSSGRRVQVTAAQAAGATKTPAHVAGLTGWWKADAITGLADAAAVASWPDASNNGRDLAQSVAANQPTYRTNVINGKPVVRFDGIDDHLQSSAPVSAFFTPGAKTIFVVFRLAAHTSSQGAASRWDATGLISEENSYLGIHLSSGFGVSWYHWDGNEDAVDKAISLNTWLRLEARHGGGSIYHRHNKAGEAAALSGDTPVGGLAGVMNVGRNWAASPTVRYLNGDIAEVFVYDVALSLADRDELDAYLVEKYGLGIVRVTLAAGVSIAPGLQLGVRAVRGAAVPLTPRLPAPRLGFAR